MESRKTLLSFRLFHLSFNSSRPSRRQRIVGAPVEAHSAGADGQVPKAVLRQNALGHAGAHAPAAENDVALLRIQFAMPGDLQLLPDHSPFFRESSVSDSHS